MPNKLSNAVQKARNGKASGTPKTSRGNSRFLNIADRDPGRSWYRIVGKNDKGETEISIMEEIGMWGITAKDFRNSIKRLGAKEPLHVHINSDGGDILEGFEIYNTLREHEGPVRVSIGAIAASMASVIAMAGEKITAAENSFVMIHNPWTVAMGDSQDLRKDADTMDKMKANIIKAYRQHSTLPDQEISDLMDDETWMTAEEAQQNGFIHEIEGFETSAQNFDLSKFRNSAKFLSKLLKLNRSSRQREGGVTLEDLENAIGAKTESQPNERPKMKMKNLMFHKEDAGGGSGGGGSPQLTQEQIQQQVKDEAEKLFQAKLKNDQEIDAVVVAVRKRDKKDFGELAGKFKRENKTADQFKIAISTSDEFKPFDVVGSGEEGDVEIEVLGVRGLQKGSPGEMFILSPEYKALADKIKGRGRGSLPQNFAQRVELKNADIRFMNAQAVPSSSGLTSIEKLPGVVTLGLRVLTVKDLILPGQTNATTIRYIREVSFTNYATTVAEAAAKPQAQFEYAEVDAPVKKIAGYVKMPDELLADYAGVASFINMRLPYMVERTEEDQLLNGDGTGNNLTGILNTSGIQTQARGTDTRADAIFKALTNIRFGTGLAEGGWEPDGVVVNPLDWENLRLAKDANNQYYGGGPFTAAYGNGALIQMESIWGKPCVVTPAIAAGTALAGAFRLGSQYFQRQGMTVEMTNSDQDDFIKNRVTVRAELREALAVYRPVGFCQITGL